MLKLGNNLVTKFHVLMRISQIYDSKNVALNQFIGEFLETINTLIKRNATLSLKIVKDDFFLNDQRLRYSVEGFTSFKYLSTQWKKRLIGEVIFKALMGEEMLRHFIYAFINLEEGRDENGRSGMFTSALLSRAQGRTVALYATGRAHAGERLREVLERRPPELPPPIQMCDALSRNPSKQFQTILANCLAHGRRQFVDIAPDFPQESQHVLESLGEVYQYDAQAKSRTFKPWSHVVSLIFAQLTHALGLNDVCDALCLNAGPLSALRGATPPSKNALSHANRERDAAMAAVERIDVGMARVNAPTTGIDFWAPFGGAKESSVGPREQGKADLHKLERENGDQPHEPGHIEDGLRPVFEATGVVPHFAMDVQALSAANLAKVRLLVILREQIPVLNSQACLMTGSALYAAHPRICSRKSNNSY